jgi:hypothetical protein
LGPYGLFRISDGIASLLIFENGAAIGLAVGSGFATGTGPAIGFATGSILQGSIRKGAYASTYSARSNLAPADSATTLAVVATLGVVFVTPGLVLASSHAAKHRFLRVT